MKINRNRSKAKAAMSKTGNTTNRPEQLLAAVLLQSHLPLWCKVMREEELSLFDADNPGKSYVITVDIAIVDMGKKFAIELNGPPHDEMPQIRRDNRRQTILEWKANDWKYIEFDYTKMPNLFKRAKGKITLDEAIAAYEEIIIAVNNVLPLGEPKKLLIETVLREIQIDDSDQVS